MTEQRTISWNAQSLRLLRQHYEAAKAAQQEQFTLLLEGEEPLEFVTADAHYLLEYLGPQFGLRKEQHVRR